MALIALYVLVIWRMLRIAGRAKSLYGTLLAAGVAGMIVFQAFVNIGMTIGIMPVPGFRCPLSALAAHLWWYSGWPSGSSRVCS